MRAVFYPCLLLLLLLAATAAAQQRPIFDPDDFVDPRQQGGGVFISRLVLGGVTNFVDDYRPLHAGGGFLHFTSSVYWHRFQFDYKHSEIRVGPRTIDRQICNCIPPVYFPTIPFGEPPAAPPQSRKETLQVGGYYTRRSGSVGPRMMLRIRLTFSQQPVNTVVRLSDKKTIFQRLHGHDRSFGLDADTYFPIAGHDIFGSLVFARTAGSGTTGNRSQSEFTYTSRFPGIAWVRARVIFRPLLTVGGVSGRGIAGLNVVNPAFEAFWHSSSTEANVHLVWSPQATRSAAKGWETHHQIALFVDRRLSPVIFFGQQSH